MTWSEKFAAHLASRGISQLDVAFELRAYGVKATQSQVHYWCKGSVPREATRTPIERWSGGAVPASCESSAESGEHPAVDVDADPAASA